MTHSTRLHISRRAVLLGSLAVATGPSPTPAQPAPSRSTSSDLRAEKLVAAAAAQVGVTTIYDPAYVRLAFPGGDVPRERGVCTDVVVRAYRDAFGIDLQALVNADMRADFDKYPTRWQLKTPDPSIDHRRVPNLRAFFSRQGAERPAPANNADWQPGDLVTQELVSPQVSKPGLPHIGIISDRMNSSGAHPLVIHNIGSGTRFEDILASFRITGRYRWQL